MRMLAIFLGACAPTVAVVQIPARQLPPIPPAENVAQAEPEPEPDEKIPPVFDFDGVDVSGAPAPAPRVRRCPPPTVTVGGSCLTPVSKSGPPNGCTLALNSIPASHVFVDGGYIGMTPQLGVDRAAGNHTVVFLSQDDSIKKSISATCVAGEKKTVVAKLLP